ncbi:uncharacterized protein TRIADDRAFT_5189, partial [Trichoplax adhaerens]
TYRLYPPVPLTLRQTIHDDEIGGYFVPKGTVITIIPPYRYYENSRYLQDPLKFDPDRWDNSAKNISPYINLSFLRGPRTCIGSKFAETELKCVLSLLLSHFSFRAVPNLPVKRKL